ncbi:Gfo/Idh/MocA family protein [Paenibacillus puerhi]|uniref:Gfo/Idh/MocA family protein n=1 Tax=Paenibacillus puerhi TaxID=2692622 RepID=UPI0013585CAC|nr:Gfo/Idh/MocA family oxidoreductase [Paenibacillus puerhi]
MKAILVGLGTAGFSWYKRLKAQGMLTAVVETNAAMKTKLGDDEVPFFTSLDTALNEQAADFLVNVTTPAGHTAVNLAAFDRRLPVLCEKPISSSYDESVLIVERAQREGIPFMIAENYRRFPYIRKLKQLIEQGSIGRLSALSIDFHRYHRVQRNYSVSLLEDIGVHHLDLLRYLCGEEGERILARLYNPLHGWEERGAVLSAEVLLQFRNGIHATYTASIASRCKPTPWCGNIRAEGTEGALELTDMKITHHHRDQSVLIEDLSGIDTTDTLAEFLNSLREQREPESSGRDYIQTERLVYDARRSHEQQQFLDLGMGREETK